MMNWYIAIWMVAGERRWRLVRGRTLDEARTQFKDWFHGVSELFFTYAIYPLEADGAYWNGTSFVRIDEAIEIVFGPKAMPELGEPQRET